MKQANNWVSYQKLLRLLCRLYGKLEESIGRRKGERKNIKFKVCHKKLGSSLRFRAFVHHLLFLVSISNNRCHWNIHHDNGCHSSANWNNTWAIHGGLCSGFRRSCWHLYSANWAFRCSQFYSLDGYSLLFRSFIQS